MALRPLSAVSWGLLAGPPQIVEGMEILADIREPSLEITLEANSITVEISAVSWGLLAWPPQIVEGMEISADIRELSLEITLEADSITVEIDDE